MRNVNHMGVILAVACSLTIFQFCIQENGKGDSTELAKRANDEKFRDRETHQDADFVLKAVESNFEEIKLAQLAQEKSGYEKLVSLAKEVESEYVRELETLKVLATRKVITLPTDLSKEEKEKLEDLKKVDAKEFNHRWTTEMIDKHKRLIKDLESGLKDDMLDSDVKDWVVETLPKVRSHLDKLTVLKQDLKPKS